MSSIEKALDTVLGRKTTPEIDPVERLEDIAVGMHDRLNDHETKIHHVADVAENHAHHLENLHEKANHLADVVENHAEHLDELKGK